MSHFCLCLITQDKPTDESISEALQPFHEFECTGEDDQYVKNVSILEDVKRDYNSDTRSMLKSQDGKLHDKYDEQFYREPTEEESKTVGKMFGTGCGNGIGWTSRDWGDGLGYRPKVSFIPEGYEEVEVKICDLMATSQYVENWYGYKSVPTWATPDLDKEHKYGYALVDEKNNVIDVIRRTNPDKKWDWWTVGGRYSDRLLVGDQGVNVAQKKTITNEFTSFAFLRDGHWAENGEMGWWGHVSNESDTWPDDFRRLYADVPDDHWVTIIDCHI